MTEALTNALDDCLTQILAGKSLEETLKLYPMWADELRPLLKAALAYARAFPDEIAADRAAGRQPLEELDTLVPNHSFLRV